MTGVPAEENGYRRATPRLPTGVVVASVVVALFSVSGLIYLLYNRTRGPGEILREFARRVDRRDCAGSYDLLDERVTATMSEDQWCEGGLPSVDEQLDAAFKLERAVLEGQIAEVHVSGVATRVWELRRFGENSWRVLGPAGGLIVKIISPGPL